MPNMITQWFERILSSPQLVALTLLLLVGSVVIGVASDILAPVITGLIIAYLLDGLVTYLRRFGMSNMSSLLLVYLLFIGLLILFLAVTLPTMTLQVRDFLQGLPQIAAQGQQLLLQLPQMYPHVIDEQQVVLFISDLRTEITDIVQTLLSTVFTSISGLITILVYLVLVPLLVFFFLKDKDVLLEWFSRFLPSEENRSLTLEVWREVNQKMSGYIRGKLVEVVIVWAVSWIVFEIFGLNYALLLAFLVGVSVVIPFLGAVVVTVPIVMVSYAQWGFGNEFLYLLIVYGVILFLDGNILVPLLFAEAVNLHPSAIIAAILIFGGLWGFWGVFFAIPLMTLLDAVIKAWPHSSTQPV